ncbi:transcription regulator HTH, apses-type DNA-binding domain-containing protein [Absidia repens]|uniref:Transcription regulator HTH, apses-type DNA-binding domain-containing protein n=1 Tax=Absidia repens TaxID=90262 RepID=A0A1X2IJ02_9FUNG|nr:transcription regulator HTH, apses-type DNA-binding domain-containing protein [Absidia repens]
MVGWSSPGGYSWPNPVSSSYPPPPHPHHHPAAAAARHSPYSSSTSCYALPNHTPIQRPKLTTTVWEDEGTVCYQVDAKSVCVARRQDNDMINGTKLLNVVGMSRGKRDGILKNEKGRIVVKVGAMHLKGVWITFERAKDLASKFKITELLYPLFTDDPAVFLCPSTVSGANESATSSSMLPPTSTSQNNMSMMLPSSTRPMNPPSFQYKQDPSYGFPMSSWDRSCHTDSNNDSFTSKLCTILEKSISSNLFFLS